MPDPLIFLAHAGATLYMTGVIWLVQLVHYPSFLWIDQERFVRFEHFHAAATAWVVAPAMIIELATAAGLVWLLPDSASQAWKSLHYANLVIVLLIWASTFLLSVPAHGTLAKSRDEAAIRFLIRTNWVRTILWTGKSALLFYTLADMMN